MDQDGKSIWAPQIETAAGPKYLAIADALAADVRTGRLKPGDRLPPQRELARALSVDLTTVTRAFAEAQRRGLIDAQAGRGSYVRATRADSVTLQAAPILDMSMNMPPQPDAARLQEHIQRGIADIIAAPNALAQLHYQDSAGIAAHRAAATAWLSRRLDGVTVERVLIAAGAQMALHAILDLHLLPGDTLCAGALTYPGLKAIADHRGFRIAPVPMDGQGLLPDAFEAACRTGRPKLLVCVPTLDNPTTATMSRERRLDLVSVARRHGIPIVEDDAYGALPAHAPPPIAALAPDMTWHIASLSKCATPALRIAYVVAPNAADLQRLASEIRVTSLMAAPLMSALAARWIGNGTLDRINAAIRTENVARQTMAHRLLGDATFAAHPEGHHLWLTLPAHWQRAGFVTQALRSGLSVVSSDAFATTSEPPEAVRVSLGVVPDRSQLDRALRLLGDLLARKAGTPII